jgi:coenzyme F420 hydrogenase subunit beta
MKTPISEIVQNDLCCGCGVCAAVCPHDLLEMNWDEEKGELIPIVKRSCKNDCQLCQEVCPFSFGQNGKNFVYEETFCNVENMHYNEITGYYLEAYVGYSTRSGQRERGASGGMVTWTLETLLKEGHIAGAITVINSPDYKGRLFEYAILNHPGEIQKAAKSKYYPVDLAQTIRQIIKEKSQAKYAVVALPCRAQALRRAMIKMPKLKAKIAFILGLTCGQLPNRHYTEYLAEAGGIPLANLAEVDFRRKQSGQHAGNFGFVPKDKTGREGGLIPYSTLPFYLCYHYFFTHRACQYCDDIFAEAADATFMDAWLPEFARDPQGHSLILVRNKSLDQLLCNTLADCQIEEISVNAVMQSQAGVIKNRREILAGRLWYAKTKGYRIPERCVNPSEKNYKAYKYRLNLQDAILNQSKILWYEVRNNGGIKEFHKKIRFLEWQLALLNFINRGRAFIRHPFSALKRKFRSLLEGIKTL